MLGWLKGKTELRRTGHQIYARIVAQSRQPEFYQACAVADSMDGRLEMVMLHVVLLLDRLRSEGPVAQKLGQQVIERFVADMDDALRRIGLGDDSVAGRLPRLGAALSERSKDYCAAFDLAAGLPDDALERTLLTHVYRQTDADTDADSVAPVPPQAKRLAQYVRLARQTLAAAQTPVVLAGQVQFPDVSASPAAHEEMPL